MLKFMKYEIKGTYRFIMMLVIAVLGASTGLQLSALRGMKGNLESFPTFLPFILGLVIFGAFISASFYIISSFRKELYEDRGYLTFSLPLTGKQIVGTKLLIALMWSAVIGLGIVIFNLSLGSILFGTRWIEGFKQIFRYESIIKVVISLILSGILSAVISLLLIYFSMTISKVSIKNKKIGGLWFILFLIISGVVNLITLKVSTLVPYYLDLNTFKIVKDTVSIFSNSTGPTLQILSGANMSGTLVATGNQVIINLGAYVFSILVGLATFFATSYLIDKKVEI